MMLSRHFFGLLCLMAVGFLQLVGSAEAALRAGASRINIVPPFPTLMGGFYDRMQNFQGVHDEVYARALALDNGTKKLVFISADLRSVDADLVRLTREMIVQSTGIPSTDILVCSTHNHSGPSYHQRTHLGKDDVEPSLKKFLAQQFSAAAIEAVRAMVAAKVGFGAGNLTGMTRNRQQKNDLIDPQVGVLRVEELEGRKTIATLFNFTGHPVTIGSANLLLSGEYPGAAARAVENLLGGIAIFTQGACGDITINRDGEPFLEIERLGRTLAGEVIKTSGLIKLEDNLVLKSASITLTLPARQLPTVDEAKNDVAKGKAALELARQHHASPGAIALLEDKTRVHATALMMAQVIAEDPSRKETELMAEVQVLQVGNVLFGTIPGEIFVEYGLELRSRVKQETGNAFCLVGYANGYDGYIITPRAAETGGYEASVARLNAAAGREMTEAAMALVQTLSQQ